MLTANRGLCGGFNGNLQRAGFHRWLELKQSIPNCRLEIVGKRGIAAFKFRGITPDITYTHFEDKPAFDEVDVIASRYLDEYTTGKLDRLDVVYTKFQSIARQQVAIETLLPLTRDRCRTAARALAKPVAPRRSKLGAGRFTNSCLRPRASWKKSCRPASKSNCSSVSSTRP